MQKGLYRSDCSLRPNRTTRLVQDLYWYVKVNKVPANQVRKALGITFLELNHLYQGRKSPDEALSNRIRNYLKEAASA